MSSAAVRQQVEEALQRHREVVRRDIRREMLDLLVKAGLVKEETPCLLKPCGDPIETEVDGKSLSTTSTALPERVQRILDEKPRRRQRRA